MCVVAGSQPGLRNRVSKIDNCKILGRPILQGRFRNWVTKISIHQTVGRPIFQGKPQNTLSSTINMYLLFGIRHNTLTQSHCHGNYIEVKIFNYMLKIDILRNSSQDFFWGCPTG